MINAIPIVGYHEISKDDDIATSPELFYLEMEYLHDNGFKVITIDDLGYDKSQERFYVKNINTLVGSEEYSQVQDTSPTWIETIRTQQTGHDGSAYSQVQNTIPTWYKPNIIQSLDIVE